MIKSLLINRIAIPIWLIVLAVYTIFNPNLILTIMKNHKTIQQQTNDLTIKNL